MTSVEWRLSRHARRLFTLALAGLLFAVITRRPELAGLAAPALLLLAGARERHPPEVAVTATLSSGRVFEGEQVAIDLSVEADQTASWLLHPGPRVEPLDAVTAEGAVARLLIAPQRWGRRRAGTVTLTLRDRWRISEGTATVRLPKMDCYPDPAAQKDRVVLSRLPNRPGEHPARAAGEGIEFAGVREYVPGDRQRQINWAASTRRGRLMVNMQSAERSQDVVLLVDATSDVGEPGSSALDLALRGASAAARAYLDARDRVGVVCYQWGGAVRVAPPAGEPVPGVGADARLLTAHLAESGSRVAALRTQVRVLLLGAALLAAAAGIGMLPAESGSAGAVLRVVAALAAILAAALVLPRTCRSECP